MTISELDRIVRRLQEMDLSVEEQNLLNGWLNLFDSDINTAITFAEKIKEASQV